MSNRKKTKNRQGLRATTSAIDEIANFSGRFNGYICDTCDKGFLTLDIDRGVTPMFSPCFATEGCAGRAHSMMYPPGEPPAELGEPIIYWYKPNDEEFKKLPPSVQDHVRRGGLARKATTSAPDWVKNWLKELG